MTDAPIRVLLVDDEGLVRAGLSMILGGASDIDVVGEASDGSQALASVEALRPDVVLMDIRMPVMNGLDATRALHDHACPPHVIVLTTFDADDYVLQALSSGAEGFLLKDTPPTQIVQAVRNVAAGEPMLSPSVTRQLIQQVVTHRPDSRADDAAARLTELTEREREVAVAVGQGLSNAEIAASLYMSVATVKAHVSRVMTKMDATNRTQIAICVHDAGLI